MTLPPDTAPLLQVQQLHAHYGKSHILRGVTFDVRRREIVSLLGRNGAGRSTTLKAVMGLVPPTGGAVQFNGRALAGQRPFRINRQGLAFVPEEREVFANLTVDENLRMGEQPAVGGAPPWTLDEVFGYFPRLRERRNTRAGSLSGGEQQMLTLSRSLLGNPLLMLIDEPTEGLAPKIVQAVGEFIQDIHRRGVAVVLVEQKLTIALKMSSRVCVMGHGHIVFDGTPAALKDSPQLMDAWLAV